MQAAHPEVSLTAMYNVLEGLREGRALTVKEKAVHDAGLVSVLRQLHDDLDAAGAEAYGWPADLQDAEILTRLVALNAQRAAEEARGVIRYLRPEYQNLAGAKTQAQDDLKLPAPKKVRSAVRPGKGKAPWPKPLAERVKAVEAALRAADAPATPAVLAKCFSRAKPEEVAEILDTLVTLGRASKSRDRYSA